MRRAARGGRSRIQLGAAMAEEVCVLGKTMRELARPCGEGEGGKWEESRASLQLCEVVDRWVWIGSEIFVGLSILLR